MSNYPTYHSLIQKLAGKIITRVVKNGEPLSSAIKEAITYAELDRQQTIHLCSILQEYNMPYNGDPMDFFRMSEDMGKNFPNPADGYVVYASAGSMKPVFEAIDQLKQAGFTSKQIIAMNEELEPIVNTIDEADGVEPQEDDGRQTLIANFMRSIASEYKIVDELEAITDEAINELQSALDRVESIEGTSVKTEAPEEEFAIAASSRMKNIKKAQLDAPEGEGDAQEPSPDNIKGLLDEANAPEAGGNADETMDLGDAGLDNAGGDAELDLGGDMGGDTGGVSAKVSPTPAELKDALSNITKWDVDNILSIQKAEHDLEKIRKDFEAVIFNENINLDPAGVKQYDEVREMIDAELEKIKEAQKETKKLEDKENDLQEEFQVGDGQDVPTAEMIAPQAEAAPETPVDEEISVRE